MIGRSPEPIKSFLPKGMTSIFTTPLLLPPPLTTFIPFLYMEFNRKGYLIFFCLLKKTLFCSSKEVFCLFWLKISTPLNELQGRLIVGFVFSFRLSFVLLLSALCILSFSDTFSLYLLPMLFLCLSVSRPAVFSNFFSECY